jgi:polysaccharide export outer membrane protein
MTSQPAVTQIDSHSKQNRLQEQLQKQVALISVADYRDYKVGAEDLLEINFLDTEKLRSEVRVNGQGEISLLLVGTVPVAGLTPSEVGKKLTTLSKEGNYLKNPNITVAVKEYRHQRVAVTGAVNKPDAYSLIGPRTLLEVLGNAGGLSDKAGETAHIIRGRKGPAVASSATPQSFSPGTETIVVDLNRLLLKGALELNYPIQNGDVVFVPYAQTAYVLGAVARPGGVPIKDNMTVTKAVSQAGGLHIMLASYHATILRLDESGQRQTIAVDLGKITKGAEADPPLKENDIVYVQESGFRRFLFDFKMLLPGSVSIAPAAMM